jgi:hypothetical protein
MGATMKASKRLLALLLTVLFIGLSRPVEEASLIRLRVREPGSGGPLPERRREDFRLTINGQPVEILALEKKSMSLGRKPDLGRTFILSFRLTRIGPSLDKALDYLASEVFDIRDTLFVRTPASLYRIGIVANKESTLRRVRELVNTDGREYEAERASAERRLEDYQTEVKGAITGDPQSVDTYKRTSMFLNSCPGQFTNYQERFLLPDPQSYRQTLDQIPVGEGEKWWIHFEQHEVSNLFLMIQRAADSIKGYLQGLAEPHQKMAQVLGTQLANIETLVSLPEAFPTTRLEETLLAHDMNYSVIFFRGLKGTEPDYAETPFHNLEMLTRHVTASCGGLTLTPSGPGSGIKELTAHVDEYYELVLADDREAGNRTIRVEPADGNRVLSYATRLEESQVRSRIQFESQEKIQVDGISVDGNQLLFDVRSFALNEGEKIGILKVRVEAYDLQGRGVYNQENTLRATQDRVSISLPMPAGLKGPCKVVITACDMVANRMTVVEGRIDLQKPEAAP